MKKIITIVAIAVFVGIAVYLVASQQGQQVSLPTSTTPISKSPIICPNDVITCPSGGRGEPSYSIELHRVPPACEFPVCPG